MKIRYTIPKLLKRNARIMVKRANDILAEYEAQGLILTLRQLYYQFVARGFLGNKQKNYKRLGKVIGDARLMGRVSWDAIEDRTRSLKLLQHFKGPQDALDRLARWYAVDLWKNQKFRPEVWIEKDALTGVIEKVCDENDVPYFSCRGYTSLSEMWRASERLKGWLASGQRPFIIHFGDHDPSGVDMSRDILARLSQTFMADCSFERVALTMAQVEEYQPPPNPVKQTDSRYKTYVAEFGVEECWELDALEPSKFRELIESSLNPLRDQKVWDKDVKEREQVRKQLVEVGKEWQEIPQRKKDLKTAQEEIVVLTVKVASLSESLRIARKKRKNLPSS
jgi:hypothetical protein